MPLQQRASGKQYGDTQRLTEIASGLKQQNGVTVERGAQGRPPGSGNTFSQPASVSPQGSPQAVDSAHHDIFKDYSQKAAVASVAQSLLQIPWAGPFAQLIARNAAAQLAEAEHKVTYQTPSPLP